MGHNLGMNHDFTSITNGVRVPRFDSANRPCTDIGGIMDYDQVRLVLGMATS
jgi:hypothetical protein